MVVNNEASKKGMTSIDANNVEEGTTFVPERSQHDPRNDLILRRRLQKGG
jgi:hypothetical protein